MFFPIEKAIASKCNSNSSTSGISFVHQFKWANGIKVWLLLILNFLLSLIVTNKLRNKDRAKERENKKECIQRCELLIKQTTLKRLFKRSFEVVNAQTNEELADYLHFNFVSQAILHNSHTFWYSTIVGPTNDFSAPDKSMKPTCLIASCQGLFFIWSHAECNCKFYPLNSKYIMNSLNS